MSDFGTAKSDVKEIWEYSNLTAGETEARPVKDYRKATCYVRYIRGTEAGLIVDPVCSDGSVWYHVIDTSGNDLRYFFSASGNYKMTFDVNDERLKFRISPSTSPASGSVGVKLYLGE